jgi:hypothetical protein
MGIVSRLLGRISQQAAPLWTPDEDCTHITLIALPESVDTGRTESRAAGFICGACQARLTPEEGYRLLGMTARVPATRNDALVDARRRRGGRRPGDRGRTRSDQMRRRRSDV